MKITNAMYMISSTKLRKAKKSLEETEPYFNALRNMVSRVVRHLPDVENQYMDVRPNKAPEDRIKGFIVVTADKGLATIMSLKRRWKRLSSVRTTSSSWLAS